MKIFVASDHAGFELKEFIKNALISEGHEVVDCGATSYNPTDDYPDFIWVAASAVATTPGSFGIVFGKSGTGEAIVADKAHGVRAVVGFSQNNVQLAREHNDANVLSLGSAFVTNEEAISLVKIFLNSAFRGEERHVRRLNKIKEIEEKK